MNFYKSALSFQLGSSRHTHAQCCVIKLTLWARKRGYVVAWRLRQPKRLNRTESGTANRLSAVGQEEREDKQRKRTTRSDKTATAEQMEQEKSDLQLHFVKSSALELQNAKLDAIASTNFSPARQLLRS
ncbi:hypothetical protein T12_7348 [Trichinella patagoniensis]|uniref:Uncharacterized protein n=1 Tax=Trichinella patagoniensis TaxID=990121 RepID=A0A0V1ABU8_9BILA|nr:hypothetical protein T12_7348 [Trichinella patagoniensis]